jgi:hypothetical protein
MNTYEVENAKIDYTNLGVAHTDHGILSFVIGLDFGGSGQGFGQIILDDYSEVLKTRIPTTLASSLLLGIDKLFGTDWEKLKGLPCRAYHTWGNVFAIGHYLKDKWLWYDKSKNEFVVTTFKEMTKGAEVKA